MLPVGCIHFLVLCFICGKALGAAHLAGDVKNNKEFYIVFLRDQPSVDEETVLRSHINVLSGLHGSEVDAEESLVYSYTKSFNAFAAKLSTEEADELSCMDEVLHVAKNHYHKPHTTKSWDFLGLSDKAKRQLKTESNIIVGLLDTGITPQSESFRDDGLGPPPTKWKGSCGHFANFSGCNNKIIGAKYFKLDKNPDPSDILSPVDVEGHGTHTSSTAAGAPVPNANLFRLANGTARGAVPSARLAMYKVCWSSFGCADMDILAAFEAAIHDGVDVISVSIGGLSGSYASDSIAVGSFHAMKNGIITVASAGNDGPQLGSVANHAPWILTVAASGIDRGFRSKLVLGSGQNFSGIGINGFKASKQLYPLVRGVDAAKSPGDQEGARFCVEGSLDPNKVKGKLVQCELGQWGIDSVIKGQGGIGAIIESQIYLDTAMIFMAPATMVDFTTSETIANYIKLTRSPSAVIYESEELKIPAPFLASFSSRGPSPGSDRLLKPDISAPGIDILAAYTPLKSLTGLKGDTRHSKFTIMSGTSMACPHVAGVAAYVKSFRPNWSSAAIKSAIMTTASPMSSRVNKEAEFGYGSGQINPTRALSPGLIYDMNELSYIQFLCREGYTAADLAVLTGSKLTNCSKLLPIAGEDAINYPTMQLKLKSDQQSTTGVFHRIVTNVGPPNSVYNVTVRAPKGVEIIVEPAFLSFSPALQKKNFKVVVKAKPMSSSTRIVSGSVIWRSPRYIVRSPVVIYRKGENKGVLSW